jgi:hypothetical protein
MLVNLFDNDFSHTLKQYGFDTSSAGRKPQKIEYIRNQKNFDGVTIFTNDFILNSIVNEIHTKYKIGWIQESPVIKSNVINNVKLVENKFDYILTNSLDLVDYNPTKYKYVSAGTCWISDSDIGLQNKTKKISHIVTNKHSTEGHILRHTVMRMLKNVDIYGQTPFKDKTVPHKNYEFTIIIENCRHRGYFTEKIIDCMAQGTIPIYWGDPEISKHFDNEGIIEFTSIDDLQKMKLTADEYTTRINAVKNNIEKCKKFLCADDNVSDIITELIKDK